MRYYFCHWEMICEAMSWRVLSGDTWYQEVRVEIEPRCILEGRFFGYFLEFDGLLRHFGCIYVSMPSDLCTSILLEAH